MSDNEIIKALKCLAGEEIMCKDCAFIKLEGHGFACKKNVSTTALDLINRQKAEIERLQKAGEEAVSCFNRMESLYNIKNMELRVAKAEAIKEFAERVKKAMRTGAVGRDKENRTIIDNLVKRMVGDE